MKLSEELEARGFIHQFTAETLAEIVDGEKRVVYHGVDPTADSIHAGNFVQWMLLRHLSNYGHKIILLVGGGTGMIGDPKPDVERPLIEQSEVERRVQKIKLQAENLLGGNEITVVNNYDWLGSVGLLTFLRDIGKHFTVNELIKKDAIATRLQSENGLSYTEFAYPLLQGLDYLTLYREKGCTLQTGGSDQWGNLVAGVDLIRRKEQKTVYALTVPLIIDKATGKKFGKSEGNAVWLDAEKTSPFVFYQFWFNASDESVVDYLKLFTMLSLVEIEQIALEVAQNPGARTAQKKLALEVTTIVHGFDNATAVARVSEVLFGDLTIGALNASEQALLEANAPLVTVDLKASVIDVLMVANLAKSKREARTFIESGAVTINGNKVLAVTDTMGDTVSLVLLKRGKKNLSLVKVG
ncbi:MAG: tyrosine--tRNA ligase [Parcubacteria group bacterium CG2_30_44_11]|nr:MAG: tyrosine--tRNA ligase [Parcubacteria group bacterium CG2_30_44_11]